MELKEIFCKRIGRLAFFLICILPMVVPMLLISFGMNLLTTNLLMFFKFIFLNPVSLIVYSIVAAFSDLWRVRSIMSSRPDIETFVITVSILILTHAIPFLGLVIFPVLLFVPEGFSRSAFYRDNIQSIVENLTHNIASFFMKKMD